MPEAPVDEALIAELMDRVKEDDFQDIDLGSIDVSFSELAGISAEELQQFLEEKVGVSPDESIQGTFTGVLVTPATHC
ncbi:thioviridamide family RiPP peptide [Streptosporangium sp. CA-135522]|uniref:thioviridamide family RiPP peptide n=1 Tax=Streptosporangium sp. CA-135522 TaxID=3240072 RepID=UPI003D8E8099